MGDRGDPQGPWQDYGGDAWNPRVPPPDPGPGPGQSYLPVPRYRPEPPVPAEHWSDDYGDDYSDEWDDPDYPEAEADGGPLRRAASEVAWRYRSAPLWLRATLDVSAVALVLAFVVGAALTLRGGSPTDEVGAFVAPAPTTVSTGPTGAPVPLGGSTTTASTTTTAPTTTRAPATTAPTTTVPPTTTSTRPPRGNRPPTSGTTTTTTAPPVHYENCFQAWRAGALPLHRGDPGYGPHLDDDNDGIACEPGEGF